MNPIRISSAGSDRATGYLMSSKIVRTTDSLYCGYLDAPEGPGDTAKIQLGIFDPETGNNRSTITLGEGIDNHCGPAIAMDSDGRMHAIIGTHHGPFLYRWSDSPDDPDSWSDPEPLGPDDTYPALSIDAEGTLHLAFREKGDRWQLWYRRKKQGQAWEEPVSLAISPVAGYNHFMQSLMVGPTGNLHLVFQFHFAENGQAADCRGRAAVYLRSFDSGDTWLNDADETAVLPVTIDNMKAVRYIPDGGDDRHAVRVANVLVDGQDRAWFFASLQAVTHGIVFRRDPDGWTEFDLGKWTAGLNVEGGRSSSLTRGPDGRIHLALSTNPDGKRTSWYDPTLALFHISFNEDGEDPTFARISKPDTEAANWLPALEHWDWNRTDTCCRDHHWLLFTRGLNAGGIGGNNKSALKTEVYLTRV